MAEIKHPKLSLEKELCTLERALAEDAFEAIEIYGIEEEHIISSGHTESYYVTDRCEVKTESGYCAIRLRTIANLTNNINDLKFSTVSDTYKAIMLEYADLVDYDEPIIDGDLPWVSYVLVVIDSTDIDEISILDAKTGNDLSQSDIVEAGYVLRQLRDDLKAMHYEAANYTDFDDEPYESASKRPFNPGEFIIGNECIECKAAYTYCGHEINRAWQN